MLNNIYKFTANSITQQEIALSSYAGKVLLIVNTASKCGFTKQYSELQELYKKFTALGLVVLGFPCNQFGKQEPGNEQEILQFCTIKYGVTFPLFAKINVNGKEAHPLFVYLKDCLPGDVGKAIKWNFTKFLVSKTGKVTKRFGSIDTPESLEKVIEKLL